MPHERAFSRRVSSGWVVATIATVATAVAGGCSSSSGATTAPECAKPNGTYSLTLSPTGQSENLSGDCSSATPQSIQISLSGASVSLNGQTCVWCPTGSCQIDVICGQTVSCGGTSTAIINPPSNYVQTVSFILPTSVDASTTNATAVLGPADCGYEGIAALATSTTSP
ncbi:MAG: hypothetical protein ABSF69_11935 [Polyangiaceae bacterium]